MIITVKRPSPLTATIVKPGGKAGESIEIHLNPGNNDVPDANAKALLALDTVKAWVGEGWLESKAVDTTPAAPSKPLGR